MQEVNYKEIVSWNKCLNKFSSLTTDHYFAVCYTHAIGVARTDIIPDSSFSALSNYSPGYVAKYGRLNGASLWAPKDNSDANDYLQTDLLFEYVICAVATQGNPRFAEWTMKYKLQLSLDNANFVTYQENRADKVGLDPALNVGLSQVIKCFWQVQLLPLAIPCTVRICTKRGEGIVLKFPFQVQDLMVSFLYKAKSGMVT